VLLPRAVRPSWLARLRAHWPFVAGPAAALTGVTFLPRVASPSRAVSPRLRSSSCRCSPCWASPGRRGGHDWRLIPVVPALFAFAWGASNSPPEEAARPRPRLAELRRARNHRRGRSGPGREGGHRSLDGDRSRARRGEPPRAGEPGRLRMRLRRSDRSRASISSVFSSSESSSALSRSSTPTSSSRRFSEPCSPPTVATADWRASSAPAQRPR